MAGDKRPLTFSNAPHPGAAADPSRRPGPEERPQTFPPQGLPSQHATQSLTAQRAAELLPRRTRRNNKLLVAARSRTRKFFFRTGGVMALARLATALRQHQFRRSWLLWRRFSWHRYRRRRYRRRRYRRRRFRRRRYRRRRLRLSRSWQRCLWSRRGRECLLWRSARDASWRTRLKRCSFRQAGYAPLT
jgi:hypothetical protein